MYKIFPIFLILKEYSMTTITFKEDIKISSRDTTMSVSDFLVILEENWHFPLIRELSESEITPEIHSSYLKSKSSTHRINI